MCLSSSSRVKHRGQWEFSCPGKLNIYFSLCDCSVFFFSDDVGQIWIIPNILWLSFEVASDIQSFGWFCLISVLLGKGEPILGKGKLISLLAFCCQISRVLDKQLNMWNFPNYPTKAIEGHITLYNAIVIVLNCHILLIWT